MIDPVILTKGGRYVDILFTDPATIDIRDIAWALSNINRFNGHTKVPYSVAEHSVRVSNLLKYRGYTPASQMAGLLHDATEAYLGDCATPIKQLLPQFKELEAALEKVIELRFNVVIAARPEVKAADLDMLAAERHALMPSTPDYPWEIISGISPTVYTDVTGKTPKLGGRDPVGLCGWFVTRYNQLAEEMARVNS